MSQREKPVAKTVGDALRNDATDIIELIDAGLQSYEGRSSHDDGSALDSAWYRGVTDDRAKCWRCQERDAGESMDGACDPCAAWVRGEGDDPMAAHAPWHPSQQTDPLVPQALGRFQRALIEQIYESPSPMLQTLMSLATRRRAEEMAMAELRTRAEWLHTSYRIDVAPDDATQIEFLGLELPELPSLFPPLHHDLGLEVIEWNLAWDSIERRVVMLPEECDVPPSVIVGELVEHFEPAPSAPRRFDWADYEAGAGLFTNEQVAAFWLNAND